MSDEHCETSLLFENIYENQWLADKMIFFFKNARETCFAFK